MRTFLTIGLLILNYDDAIREGDGDREELCQKYFLVFARRVNSNNYVRLFFKLLIDNKILRPAHLAYAAKWGSSISKLVTYKVRSFNKKIIYFNLKKELCCDMSLNLFKTSDFRIYKVPEVLWATLARS